MIEDFSFELDIDYTYEIEPYEMFILNHHHDNGEFSVGLAFSINQDYPEEPSIFGIGPTGHHEQEPIQFPGYGDFGMDFLPHDPEREQVYANFNGFDWASMDS